ncbi:MAG: RNA polymerase sigma factor [Polyangiaceae bacterium]
MSTRAANLPVPAPATPDALLLARLAQGDIGALGELYDRHQQPLRRFLSRATCGHADVDDLVHATFLIAAESAARYDGRSACRPWLIGIAVRLVRRRRRSLYGFLSMLTSLGATRASSADPRASLHERTDVERALERLSEPKRVTLLLAEVEGLSCPEIAELLAIPVGTVWTRLHAARRELRAWLTDGRTK